MQRRPGVTAVAIVVGGLLLQLSGRVGAQEAAPLFGGTVTLRSGAALTGAIKVAELGVVLGSGVGSVQTDYGAFRLRAGDGEVTIAGRDVASVDVDWEQQGTASEPRWLITRVVVTRRDGTRVTGQPTWLLHCSTVSVTLPDGMTRRAHAFPLGGTKDFSPENFIRRIEITTPPPPAGSLAGEPRVGPRASTSVPVAGGGTSPAPPRGTASEAPLPGTAIVDGRFDEQRLTPLLSGTEYVVEGCELLVVREKQSADAPAEPAAGAATMACEALWLSAYPDEVITPDDLVAPAADTGERRIDTERRAQILRQLATRRRIPAETTSGGEMRSQGRLVWAVLRSQPGNYCVEVRSVREPARKWLSPAFSFIPVVVCDLPVRAEASPQAGGPVGTCAFIGYRILGTQKQWYRVVFRLVLGGWGQSGDQ